MTHFTIILQPALNLGARFFTLIFLAKTLYAFFFHHIRATYTGHFTFINPFTVITSDEDANYEGTHGAVFPSFCYFLLSAFSQTPSTYVPSLM
jgi:hypothetical protein